MTKFESSWVLKTGMVNGQEDLFQIREKLQKDGEPPLPERVVLVLSGLEWHGQGNFIF